MSTVHDMGGVHGFGRSLENATGVHEVPGRLVVQCEGLILAFGESAVMLYGRTGIAESSFLGVFFVGI